MKTLFRFASFALALSAASVASAEPQPKEPGTVTWEKDGPKVTPAQPGQPKGAVEVTGAYTTNPGFTLKTAEVFYSPAEGGVMTSGDKLDFADGKFGELKNGKIGPKPVPLAKGRWQVWVIASFTPAGGGQLVPYWSRIETIEVK